MWSSSKLSKCCRYMSNMLSTTEICDFNSTVNLALTTVSSPGTEATSWSSRCCLLYFLRLDRKSLNHLSITEIWRCEQMLVINSIIHLKYRFQVLYHTWLTHAFPTLHTWISYGGHPGNGVGMGNKAQDMHLGLTAGPRSVCPDDSESRQMAQESASQWVLGSNHKTILLLLIILNKLR